jgi:hypothetical protein
MASTEIKNEALIALLEKDGPFPLEFAQQESRPVLSVDHVHITIVSFMGNKYALITALGKVPTTGWTQARLDPYIYIQPPPDGIWDFVFVAKPPSGIAADVVLPIAATYLWKIGSFHLKGVRVHSATNAIEELIGKSTKIAA